MIDATITNGISILSVFFFIGSAAMSAVTPRITSMLIMLLPSTFPTVIPAPAGESAAFMLTAASGALVPMATIVNPTTISGMLHLTAILDAPSTNTSAPFIINTNPSTRSSI